MTRSLLDTNIVSDLMKAPAASRSLDRLDAVGGDHAYASIVVAGELRFEAAEVENMLAQLPAVPLHPPVEAVYADLRADLERVGTSIGANDLWIAAQALHDDGVLVTDNVREFGRVPGLRVENWLA